MNLFELSAKISADTKDYEKAVKNATKVSKSLKDIMERSATQSETNKNKIKVLAGEYSSAKSKVAILTTAFNKAAKEEGVTAERTKQLAKELQEAEKESSDLKGQLDELTKKSKHAGDGFSKFGSALGKGLKTAAKIGTAAVGMASTAIVGLTKQAVESYAEYEQLVGGVETLFKDSASKIEGFADRAYLTAGLSANEYMSTVTSFSASLLQSLGGDTEKAADYADMAVTDMADNANKMGTSMELIQNAYQGFAKANYTMLDNLKLGYGGTKEEMARLIKDASKLDKSIKANDMSFGNIVKAINAVQKEMGIYGTTSKEASQTISGSIASVKAQWQNLLVAVSQGDDWDLGVYIDNFIDTITTAFGNIMPVALKTLSGIGNLIDSVFPVIMEQIPTIINDTLPTLLQSGVNIIKELLNGITNDPDLVVDTIMLVVDTLVDAVIDLLPELVVTGVLLIGKLAAGLIQAIPDIISKIPEIVDEIVDGFSEHSGEFLEIGKDIVMGIWKGWKARWGNVKKWISDAWHGLIGDSEKTLEIHSPSKVFGRMGKFMALGVGEGWADTFGDVEDEIENSLDFGNADYGVMTTSSTITSNGYGDRNSYATQNVNVTVGIDDSANALGLARALLPFLKIAEKEVYA